VLWFLTLPYNNYDIYSYTEPSSLTLYVVGLRPSLAGAADSNLSGNMDVSLFESSLLSGRGTCVGLVTLLESFIDCRVYENIACRLTIIDLSPPYKIFECFSKIDLTFFKHCQKISILSQSR